MKKSIMLLIVAALSMLTLIDNAGAVRKPDVAKQMKGAEIFSETTGETTETGKVDLIVKISLKTHRDGYYLLESRDSLHGKAGYPFIVTIEGQSALWREEGWIETTPTYDKNGIRIPDGGKGRRYILQKRLRMAPGSRKIEIDLPEEDYSIQAEVDLKERDKPYLLEFKPIYGKTGNRLPSFNNHVARLDIVLDGNAILPVRYSVPQK